MQYAACHIRTHFYSLNLSTAESERGSPLSAILLKRERDQRKEGGKKIGSLILLFFLGWGYKSSSEGGRVPTRMPLPFSSAHIYGKGERVRIDDEGAPQFRPFDVTPECPLWHV